MDVRVHLVARAHPKVTALPVLDRIEVATGKQGRFEARLLKGVDYGAFALREEDEASYRRTAVLGGVQAGERRILRFVSERNGHVRVRVDGRKAWKTEEPLRFLARVTPPKDAPWVLREFDPEGKRRLPMMPGDKVQILVRGKSGRLLANASLDVSTTKLQKMAADQAGLEQGEREKQTLLFVEPHLLRLRISPPVKMLLAVTAGAPKKPGLLQKLLGAKTIQKPVKGARIWIHDRCRRFLAATTDEKGLAIVSLPELWRGTQPVLVEADGFATTAVSLRRDQAAKGRDLAVLREAGTADASIGLLPGKRTRTRILLGKGKPAARMPVLMERPVSMGKFSTIHYGLPWLLWTDDKGGLDLPGQAPDLPCRLDLVLDPASRTRFSGSSKTTCRPLVTIYQGANLPNELPKSLDLGDFVPLQVQVKSPPGADILAPEVLICRLHKGKLEEDSVRSVLADVRGRLTLLLPRTGDWAIGACSDAGIQLDRLHLAAREEVQPFEIRLQGSLFLEGVVKTSGGDPLPGTRIHCRSKKTTRAEMGLLKGVRHYEKLLHPESDKKGRFRLAIPEANHTYTLSFSVPQKGGGRISMSTWNQRVEVGKESRKDVEVTIDPPGR